MVAEDLNDNQLTEIGRIISVDKNGSYIEIALEWLKGNYLTSLDKSLSAIFYMKMEGVKDVTTKWTYIL